jgi:gliding motility-associated-like protein
MPHPQVQTIMYGIRETRRVGQDSIRLSYYPKPIVRLGADTAVCEETPLQLWAWHINADSLMWSDGSVGNMLTVKYGGEYMVTGINKCGTGSDTILVKQVFCDIWLPNAFTPNGDGANDVFKVLGNIGRLEGFGFRIFNRWGEQMFHTKDRYQGWEGLYNGGPALLGTYVYMLEYSVDGKPYMQKGNFHLIR